MITHMMEQGTQEWFDVKRGKLSASLFPKLFMGKSTKGYGDAINKIVFERLTCKTPESYSNADMERGVLMEPEAIKAYEFETFTKVHRVGFVELDENVGCSPDGLIGDDGLIQVKCPRYNTLLSYHMSGKVPKDYTIQMQGEMYVTGRQWNIFYAYHPDVKPFMVQVTRDEKLIDDLEKEIDNALGLIEERLNIMKGEMK